VAAPGRGIRVSAPIRRLLAGCACVLLACAAAAQPQNRVAFAEYEISGPGERVELDAGLAGSTRLEGALGAGESRRVLVPVPVSPGAPPLEPRAGTSGAAARFLGWRERDERLARIPAALRARPAPVASAARVRVGAAVLLVLGAAGLAGLWLARRPLAASLLALAAGGMVHVLARGALDRDAAPVEVLDGVAGSGTWQRARAARDALVLPARGPTFDLAVDPARAPIRFEAPLDPAGEARARAKGAHLVATWAEPWPPEALDRTANELAPLAEAWLREEGDWTFRGAWPLGAALGPARPGSDPPGWLVAGLPQGVTLVVGRVEGPGRAYVRCTWP